MSLEHRPPAEVAWPDGSAVGSGAVAPAVIPWWSRLLRAAIAVGMVVGMVQLSQPPPPPTPGATWNWRGVAVLSALLLLITGPQPRLTTKWGWFWLWALVPPATLLFVALEPAPLWQRAAAVPARGRLTGGWAFLLAVVVAGVLTAYVPGYAEMFPQ